MDGMSGLGRSCAVTAFRKQTLSASNCCCLENPHLLWKIPISSLETLLICSGIFQLLSYLSCPWKWMFPARLSEFLLCFSALCGHRAVSLQLLSLLSLQHLLPSENSPGRFSRKPTAGLYRDGFTWSLTLIRVTETPNIKLFICLL